ncbi:protein family protein [Trichuris suis]|nr:protein family protein [Trichuris suis]
MISDLQQITSRYFSESPNSLFAHASSVGVSGKKRLIVAPTGLLSNNEFTFIKLKHPRTGLLTLFHVSSNGKMFELLKAGEHHRCWFVDQSVVSDGSLLLLSPFHPLYLVLPTLSKLEEFTFLPYKELIADLLDAVPQLHENNNLETSLAKVCYTKNRKGTVYYCYSEEMCLSWLCEQVEKFKNAFHRLNLLHRTILCNAGSLNSYAVGTICDYLNTCMEEKLKARLGIHSASAHDDSTEIQEGPIEEPTENYFVKSKTYNLRDSRRISTPQKRLALAAKGTTLLSSFFSK